MEGRGRTLAQRPCCRGRRRPKRRAGRTLALIASPRDGWSRFRPSKSNSTQVLPAFASILEGSSLGHCPKTFGLSWIELIGTDRPGVDRGDGTPGWIEPAALGFETQRSYPADYGAWRVDLARLLVWSGRSLGPRRSPTGKHTSHRRNRDLAPCPRLRPTPSRNIRSLGCTPVERPTTPGRSKGIERVRPPRSYVRAFPPAARALESRKSRIEFVNRQGTWARATLSIVPHALLRPRKP